MALNSFVEPVTLQGLHVRLEPLTPAHRADLTEAVRDGELWNLWYTTVPTPEGMAAEIDRRLDLQAKGSMNPWAVVATSGPLAGKAVGMTTFMNIDATNRRVEIGSTWYRKAVQRGPLNTETKRLLLAYAFEQLQCIAVELRTHWFNQQSRKAIERLGAKLDGVLRAHQVNQHPLAQGALRDTCVYSIIASEWPSVRTHLNHQLSKPRA